MLSKKQSHQNDKASSQQQFPAPEGQKPEQLPSVTSLARTIQRFRSDRGSLTQSDIFGLHQTIGNRAVGRLFSRTGQRQISSDISGKNRQTSMGNDQKQLNGIMQRVQGNPTTGLSEEEWGIVQAGGTINYTPLAAGCLAVTVQFQGGGGAGVHLAMMPNNINQWQEFMQAINGQTITQVFLDGDTIGDPQGWRVKYNLDDFKAETNERPRSSTDLQENGGMQPDQMNLQGWVMDKASIKEWFKKVLGANAQTSPTQNPTHTLQ